MEHDLVAMNKQAIAAAQKYMGHFAWQTVVLTFVVLTVYIGTIWLYAQAAIPFWPAFAILAAFGYMSYTPVHEAAHGNINGNRANLKWLNDLCGFISAQIIMVPYSTHKVEHFTHHRYTNQPGKDPDYVAKTMADGPLAFVTGCAEFMWTQITYLFQDYWATAPLREKAIYCAEVGVAILWRIALFSQLSLWSGLALILGSYVLAAGFTVYWFAFRPHHPYENPARYKNTNSLIMPQWMKPLEWFWLGQNLHSIHHAFPRVPFFKYHALFAEIEPVMRAHGGPVQGIFNRQPV